MTKKNSFSLAQVSSAFSFFDTQLAVTFVVFRIANSSGFDGGLRLVAAEVQIPVPVHTSRIRKFKLGAISNLRYMDTRQTWCQ